MLLTDTITKRTPLYDLHIELGARMFTFAGYEMPLQYASGIRHEHLHCRVAAGLFDISHMGQFIVRGPNVLAELERLLPVDLERLANDEQMYALLLNAEGGILDDLIIGQRNEQCFSVVVNAACQAQDIAYFRQRLPDTIELEVLDQHALISLQGPGAREAIQGLCPEAVGLSFMHACQASLFGIDCYISCSGYTGEDGFEISVPALKADELARALLDIEAVQAVGVGARDSLRLEAGLCLYGQDMNQNTTPVEAGLVWSIGRARRAEGEKAGGFPGEAVIFDQIAQGVKRRRVGLRVNGRVPVRQGAGLQDLQGNAIGQVCSGALTPSVDQPIAMAYVDIAFTAIGTEIQAVVRGKSYPACVAKMPFVPQRYYRG